MHDALVRLRRVIGVPFDRPLELTTRLAGEDFGDAARTVAGVPSGAERVNVATARATVDIRRAQVGIARSNRWPRTNWTIGASLSFPLFTGFRTTAEIAGAQADVRADEALAAEAAQLAAVDERERAADIVANGRDRLLARIRARRHHRDPSSST